MINNAMTTDTSYEAYITAYKALHPIRQNVLRAVACKMLQARGDSEIGSSDVSCQVFNIFRLHGEFTDDLITDLRDEWLGWATLENER